MNPYVIAVLLILIFSVSCTNNKVSKEAVEQNISLVNDAGNEGLVLMQQKCYACHSVISKSHDEIIAPPMIAVKKRYMMTYKTKAEFVQAFQNWTDNPTAEKALMRGAVNKFKVMPKQVFDKKEIGKIAAYIFENEIETPSWFNAHFKEQHPNGMGVGNGMGMKKGKG